MAGAAKPVQAGGEPLQLRIEALGAEGDGLAHLADGRPVYVPLTLPGELVQARAAGPRGRGLLAECEAVLEASPARLPPICRHFGACGGCVSQHWDRGAALAWKAEAVASALRRAGFERLPACGTIATPPGSRRRMDLGLRRTGALVAVGLHRLRSPQIVDVQECHVLHPRLAALIPALRDVLGQISGFRRIGSAVVNLLDEGADLLLRTDEALTPADRARLAAFARAQKLVRLCWAEGGDDAEPLCILRTPRLTLSGVAVTPPPGAFLQASAEGEAAIVQAVLAGLAPSLLPRARVADLYAGLGTISLPLARLARVTAFEGDAATVAALRAAAAGAGLTGRVEAERRDLVRQPLSPAEFAGFAAVVLDPPHAGAAAQMAQLASARPRWVVYVSCNPAALARDARELARAGYGVRAVTVVDQFLWSARIEAVALFCSG